MSVVPQGLKAASSIEIPFITRPQGFTTNQIIIDSLLQFQKLIKSIHIVNDDSLNIVSFRTQSPSSILKTVDVNSEVNFDEWTSYFEINPDGVSGTGLFELDLVELPNARQRGGSFHNI